MQKKQEPERRKPEKSPEKLEKIKENACGIDIGATSHWVSVPPERDSPSSKAVCVKGVRSRVRVVGGQRDGQEKETRKSWG
jgi:hypothetical protein